MSRPIDDSGASCQPTVTLIMSTPTSTACRISSKHSSSVLPPHLSISSAPFSRTTSGLSGVACLMPSISSRMNRPRFSIEPPYSSVRWLVKRELKLASR